jgi:hypothetical protein
MYRIKKEGEERTRINETVDEEKICRRRKKKHFTTLQLCLLFAGM